MSTRVRIRFGRREDVEQIFSWIVELAEYERARDQVRGDSARLESALFGPHPVAEALIADHDDGPAGFAIFYSTFSTWECRAGIWLEDLYVPPHHRRGGVATALLSHLASIAVSRGCARLEWWALDWNELALDFYEKLGASRLAEWEIHRLEGSALELVADGAR